MTNAPLLSVIIPAAQETELTREWCQKELQGIDHELVIAKSWSSGYARSTGEFVSFLEKDCVLSPNYFRTLLKVFNDKPSYRKLSMVTPILGVNSWHTRVFGYILTPTSVMPSRIRSSNQSYLIQIGFFPGAIIRRSALGLLAPKASDPLLDSINLSIVFWNNGQRVALSPDATYVSTDTQLEFPLNVARRMTKALTSTVEMWRRELIA